MQIYHWRFFEKSLNDHLIRVFTLLGCLILSLPALSFVNNSRHLTIRDGLSQSTVTTLFEDQYGFLWIGTVDGLNRYDGYSFKQYLTSRGNAKSLSYPEVTAMTEDPLGNLWVGTYGGINILNPDTEEFSHILMEGGLKVKDNAINALFKDQQGGLWVGSSKGIDKFRYLALENNKDSLIREPFVSADEAILNKNIVGIGCVDSTTIWILAADTLGFLSCNGTNKTQSSPPGFPAKAENAKCFLWSSETLFLGCENGLFSFKVNDLSAGWHEELFLGKSIRNISFIKQDPDQNLWVGSSQDGLYIFAAKEGIWKNFRHSNIHPQSLNNNVTNSMVVTLSGTVVVGTDLGLNLFDKRQALFNQLSVDQWGEEKIQNVHGMLEDRRGNIWIGTKGQGVFVYNARGELLRKFNSASFGNRLFSDNIQCVYQDRDNQYWFTTVGNGLFKIRFRGENYSSPELTHYEHSEKNPLSIAANRVNAVFEDSNGDLWFGTSNGLSRLLYSEKNKAPQATRFLNLHHDPRDCYSLPDDFVYSIYRDRLGSLWVGTFRGGIGKMVDQRDTEINLSFEQESVRPAPLFANYQKQPSDSTSLAGNDIYLIYEDQLYGYLWIATNEGLCRFSRKDNNFKVFTTDNGLSSNSIYGILEDKEGNLWLSTNRGLTKYNQKEEAFFNYGEANGLQYPEFNGKAFLRTRNGLFVFGGARGVNSFFPEQIKPNATHASVYVTGLKIKNREVRASEVKWHIRENLHQAQKIVLRHNQNFITLSFTMLNYHNPAENRFVYRLKGYDDDWNYTTGENTASYTGLPPGTYHFFLKGTDGYSTWDAQISDLVMVINPPWWFTFGAKMLYFILCFVIAFFFFKGLKRRIDLKRETEVQRMDYKKNQELYEEKLQFYTNISHEFRTPLTLIIGPIQDLILEQKDPAIIAKIMLINRNANRLKNLVDQILSLREVDAGQVSVHVIKENVELFSREVASNFNGLAARRNIRYRFEVKKMPREVWFDPDVLEKILYNLLSNAFKYTSDGGEISVFLTTLPGGRVADVFGKARIETELQPHYLALVIHDNGSGISQENLSRIFDRYFKTDRRVEGTGIGLAYAQSLALLHKGIISVKSKLNKGSSFVLYLPVGDCYQDSQKETYANYPETKMQPPEFKPFKPGVMAFSMEKPSTVLLVDDNEEMSYYIAEGLKNEFNILIAREGRQAIHILEEKKPDIVISDIIMPVMDGLELCKYLRASKSFATLPLILLSSRVDTMQKVQALETGADAYVSKPFEIPYLIAVAKRLLLQNSSMKEPQDPNLLSISLNPSRETADEKFLSRLKCSIEKNYADPKFNVESLAEDIGLSRSQLHRNFKALTETTPSNFLKEVRMTEAIKLLEEAKMSIAEICFAVGFSDPKYFSNEFRKKYGMSPSNYATPFKEKSTNI